MTLDQLLQENKDVLMRMKNEEGGDPKIFIKELKKTLDKQQKP